MSKYERVYIKQQKIEEAIKTYQNLINIESFISGVRWAEEYLRECRKRKQYPTQKEMKTWFEYEDGQLIWVSKRYKGTKIGSIAGTENKSHAYRSININRKRYLTHRCIWIWHHGDISSNMVIDHIDNNPVNNKIENLRLVTYSENNQNISRISSR